MGVRDQEAQVSIIDETGQFLGRVDGALLAYGIALEFDGVVKYTKFRRPGESLNHAILREKKREQRIRELGWEVIRFDWADLADPDDVVRRVLAMIERRRGWPRPRGSVTLVPPIRIAFPH